MKRRITAMLALSLLSSAVRRAASDATGGPKAIALVELQTSEGCSLTTGHVLQSVAASQCCDRELGETCP